MRALRLFIPGEFEDVFLYMGDLVAIGADRSLLRTNLSGALDSVAPPDLRRVARLWFERNDLLHSAGAQTLLADAAVLAVIEKSFDAYQDELFVQPSWEASGDYEVFVGGATVLDLQIYAQRLFAGTTHGVIQADLVQDDEDLYFSRPVKRTDARCLAVNVRFGAVAASCEADGLLMSFDEFGELEYHQPEELHKAATRSRRSSWLGYHVVNYEDSAHAYGLRSHYRSVWNRPAGTRNVVLTDVARDDRLLAPAERDWANADFVFNDHSRFFVHHASGDFQVFERAWAHGRLGSIVTSWRGTLERPLSAGAAAGTVVVETYGGVHALEKTGVSELFVGEAISVRTFPNSVRYRNVVAIVDGDGIHLVSPLQPATESS